MSRRSLLSLAALAAIGLAASTCLACGPFFPNTVVRDDGFVLRAPIADFDEEIARIKLPSAAFKEIAGQKSGWGQKDGPSACRIVQTADAEMDDLAAALKAQGTPRAESDGILAEYRAARQKLVEMAVARTWPFGGERDAAALPASLAVPVGLPGEFADYLKGAVAWHEGNSAKAREAWTALLARDKAERPRRTTWATFMIGKSYLESDPAKAAEWMRQVRERAKEGFVDSLALAGTSYGWEARACLNMKPPNCEQAIELYLLHGAADGFGWEGSLQTAAGMALARPPDELARMAANPPVRRVITAFVVARGGPYHDCPVDLHRKWIAALEAAKVPIAEDADRFALAAYQAGEMKLAERWLALAPAGSLTAKWLRAKLFLRAGDVPRAAEELSAIVRTLPRPDDSNYGRFGNYNTEEGVSLRGDHAAAECIRGELGSLRLARGQYAEALSVLLDGGHWLDAAYVAERVLSADELKAWVDRVCPKGPTATEGWKPWYLAKMRYLLARRFARLGRYAEAKSYYPAFWKTLEAYEEPRPPVAVDWAAQLDAYAEALKTGGDEAAPKETRTKALWKAACIARNEGMELFGAELDPDGLLFYEGEFEAPTLFDPKAKNVLVPESADEKSRVKKSRIEPFKRFHYRYVAADLAWRAADLMPDQSDETARVLCEAGSWLKNRDPKAADRFYKALVRRCGNTDLGRRADALRWFPELPRPDAAAK